MHVLTTDYMLADVKNRNTLSVLGVLKNLSQIKDSFLFSLFPEN